MSLSMIPRLIVVLLLVLAAAALLPARAADKPAFGPGLEAALDQHILPRHRAFATGAGALKEAADGYCAGGGSLEDTKAAYHQAMDGWMGLQHIGFGPIESFNRRHRIQFWPDKRHTIPEQAAEIMAEQPRDVFTEGGFTFASVAVQGLPMVERLLFGPEAEKVAPGTYGCDLLVAVSGNVAIMAGDLLAGWTEGSDSWGAELRDAAQGGSDLLGVPVDVASLLLGGVSGEFKLIREYKLQAPLGASAEAADPTAAESAFAGRSLRNVVVNLEALQELYAAAFLPPLRMVDPKLAALLERAFTQTIATAQSVPVPLTEAVADPAHRATLEKLATQAGALRQLAAERAADRLGLVLGFNSLDGD